MKKNIYTLIIALVPVIMLMVPLANPVLTFYSELMLQQLLH